MGRKKKPHIRRRKPDTITKILCKLGIHDYDIIEKKKLFTIYGCTFCGDIYKRPRKRRKKR